MYINCKVGTHGSEKARVKFKRKLPKEGDYIFIKRYPFGRGQKWFEVRVWKIQDNFYFLEYA